MDWTRRATLLGAAAAAVAPSVGFAAKRASPFALKFAPHDGMFADTAGPNILDQISFAADQGFRAWEDNMAASRPVSEQTAIAAALDKRGMTMGVFVAGIPDWGAKRPVLTGRDEAPRQAWLQVLRDAVPVAKRMNARWMTVVPGFRDDRAPHAYQMAQAIDLLRRAADIVEPHGVTMVVEPLNTGRDHPDIFVTTIDQGYALCRGVNRPSCKILADVYHAQAEAGDLIPSLERAWSEIAYIQVGDHPGRLEPGTGEINYANVLKFVVSKGFDGVIGMEHGVSGQGRDGERRVIETYRALDQSAR